MPRDGYYLPGRQLVSQEDSAIVQNATVPRSKFFNRWTRKTAFDAGYLVPILVEPIYPGDHMKYRVNIYARMSTPLFPLFDNQTIETFFFFVPYRLLWSNFQRFMGEQTDPADSIDSYLIPVLEAELSAYPVGSIYDHMGIPTAGQVTEPLGNDTLVNALPFRAYNRIWNEWFRDENIQNSVTMNTGNGPDSAYTLLRRAKAHDYFTSALPWPQKFTAPTVPVGGLAPITGIGSGGIMTSSAGVAVTETDGGSENYAFAVDMAGQAVSMYVKTTASGGARPAVYADLSQATGVAINVFRQAFMIQSLLERDARGGTRYVESIWNHFRVRNPDYRLGRPEYIGGGKTPLNITPIAQTVPTAEEPLGALGGAGTAAGQHSASYAATEHGVIIGLANIRTELSYQQGLPRYFSERTRYDLYWPSLAGLGEQAILRKEIYCTGDTANDDVVFGYQERWHHLRTRYSEVTGIMRSTAAGTIDAWHLAQEFATAPTLSTTFIQDTPPMERVLAAGENAAGQQYLVDIMYQRQAVRPIPTFGTPVTLGRF